MVSIKNGTVWQRLTFERVETKEVYVPGLQHAAKLILAHLRGVVGFHLTYPTLGTGSNGFATLRVEVMTCAGDATNPPSHFSEEVQRARWRAFEVACDSYRASLFADEQRTTFNNEVSLG